MNGYFMMKRDSRYGGVSCGVVDTDEQLLAWDRPFDSRRSYFCYWDGGRRPRADFLAPICDPFIVSGAALKLIREFRLPPTVEFGRVIILADVDGPEIGAAEMICFGKRLLEVMDPVDAEVYENCDFIDRARGLVPPPVVKYDRIKDFDLVRGHTVLGLCSERLKEAIERASLTGIEFLPVTLQ